MTDDRSVMEQGDLRIGGGDGFFGGKIFLIISIGGRGLDPYVTALCDGKMITNPKSWFLIMTSPPYDNKEAPNETR